MPQDFSLREGIVGKNKRGLKKPVPLLPTENEADESACAVARDLYELEDLYLSQARRIQAIHDETGRFARLLEDRILRNADTVRRFAEKHDTALFPTREAKSARIGTCRIGWRKTPLKVTVRNIQAALDALKARGLSEAIRVTEEVNKQFVKDHLDAISGIPSISVKENEVFFVEPLAKCGASLSYNPKRREWKLTTLKSSKKNA